MRLLYLCSDYGVPPSGIKGASIHLRAITQALCNLGHEIWLLSPKEGPGDHHPVRRLLPAGCPPADKTGRLLKKWLQGHGFNDAVAKELRPLIYNAWALDPALQALGDRQPDAILERLSLFGHLGVDLADALDIPLVVEVNAPLAEEAGTFRSLQIRDLAGEIEQRVLSRADALIAVSTQLHDRLIERGISGERVHIVPNGVDLSAFDAADTRGCCRAKLGLNDEFVVGFAGSLKLWHGVHTLLEAFRLVREQAPDARLFIVGMGPAEDSLHAATAEMNLEHVVNFTGGIPHEDVPHALRAMDVAVAPFSRLNGFYFSPIKVFEYMASGACVVASRLGQLAEVVRDGVDGLLCTPDDPQDLADKLLHLYRSPNLRRVLAENALRTIQAQYTWEHAGRRTEQTVRTVLEQRGGSTGETTASSGRCQMEARL